MISGAGRLFFPRLSDAEGPQDEMRQEAPLGLPFAQRRSSGKGFASGRRPGPCSGRISRARRGRDDGRPYRKDLDRFAGIGKARLDDGEVVHPPDAFQNDLRERDPAGEGPGLPGLARKRNAFRAVEGGQEIGAAKAIVREARREGGEGAAFTRAR